VRVQAAAGVRERYADPLNAPLFEGRYTEDTESTEDTEVERGEFLSSLQLGPFSVLSVSSVNSVLVLLRQTSSYPGGPAERNYLTAAGAGSETRARSSLRSSSAGMVWPRRA
jgi:hypothetical protein